MLLLNRLPLLKDEKIKMVKKINRFIKCLPPFFIVGLLIILYLNFFKSSCKNKQAIKYKLNNKNYCLLVADSPTKRGRGLMFYKKPVDFDGMIFIFPNKERLTFWNQNTYLDLDIYWLDSDKVVGISYLPSILKSKQIITVQSSSKVNKVIEIIK